MIKLINVMNKSKTILVNCITKFNELQLDSIRNIAFITTITKSKTELEVLLIVGLIIFLFPCRFQTIQIKKCQ